MEWKGDMTAEELERVVKEQNSWPFKAPKSLKNAVLKQGKRRCKMCHVEKTKDHKTCQMKCSSLKNCPSFYVDGHSEEKATNVALRESQGSFS